MPLRLAVLLALAYGCASNAPRQHEAPVAHTASTRLAGPSVPVELDDCNSASWCPRMVVIPSGTFTMGVPSGEPGFFEIESPQHLVTVHSFAAGKFDVTRRQWAAFESATNRPTSLGCSWDGRSKEKSDPAGSWRTLGFEQTDSHPVVCVTWNDAQDYVHWLSDRTHHQYRLLTEAEWEYAARAGTLTTFPWGDQATHERANYGADSCCSGRAEGRDQWIYTSPSGAFPPNAFGLYDMNGNVLQWVQDCFAPSYSGLPADGSPNEAPITLKLSGELSFMNGTSSCAYRMLRGGDYGDPPAMIRSGFRNFAPPPDQKLDEYRSGGVGFRVARTL